MRINFVIVIVTNVTNAGYTILFSISDNNVVNREMLMYLTNSEHLMPYIINPVNNIDNLKILFGSVS